MTGRTGRCRPQPPRRCPGRAGDRTSSTQQIPQPGAHGGVRVGGHRISQKRPEPVAGYRQLQQRLPRAGAPRRRRIAGEGCDQPGLLQREPLAEPAHVVPGESLVQPPLVPGQEIGVLDHVRTGWPLAVQVEQPSPGRSRHDQPGDEKTPVTGDVQRAGQEHPVRARRVLVAPFPVVKVAGPGQVRARPGQVPRPASRAAGLAEARQVIARPAAAAQLGDEQPVLRGSTISCRSSNSATADSDSGAPSVNLCSSTPKAMSSKGNARAPASLPAIRPNRT